MVRAEDLSDQICELTGVKRKAKSRRYLSKNEMSQIVTNLICEQRRVAHLKRRCQYLEGRLGDSKPKARKTKPD